MGFKDHIYSAIFLVFLLGSALIAGCSDGADGGSNTKGSSAATSGDSPTEAYKRLYAAVKSKSTEAIKQQLSQKTISLG